MLPGVLCGIGLAILTLFFRRRPERTSFYRIRAVATCAVVLLVPAGLLALLANDSEGEGGIFLPTYFEVFGIPLIISVPFAALGAQRVSKTFSHRANAGP
jgi:multisubunit Na+/H+ antiporter MnhB subunit